MRFLVFIAAFMILSQASLHATDAPDIRIHFGSYCCGTDIDTEEKIMDYLKYSDAIRSWKRSSAPMGKEGEHTVDINLTREADHAMIYEDLRKLIPRYSDDAPTSIEGKGFAKFETGRYPPDKKGKP